MVLLRRISWLRRILSSSFQVRSTCHRGAAPFHSVLLSRYQVHAVDCRYAHSSYSYQPDGCIVWNAHHTVFGSKRSAICAVALHFLHSTRPSVTWLNSRSSLAACDWLMSALSTVPSTRVRRRWKFRGIFLVRRLRVQATGMTMNWFQR